MRKKLISILLVAAVVLGFVPLISTANSNSGQTTMGEYNYTLVSDPDSGIPPTSDIVAGGFGDRESNGRIWTDKSVFVNDEGNGFNVDLKVLAQEYYSTSNTTITQPVGADVVMILDFTSSMYSSNNKIEKEDGRLVTRFEALIDAFNESIDIITTSNDNNRISAYAFYGGGSSTFNCINFMPLAHYTSTSTATETKNKYVYMESSGGYKCRSSTGLLKDGQPFTINQSCNNYTDTQYGIANGVKGLVDDINNETDNTVLRKPYVIMMTDGGPTSVDFDWFDTPTNLKGNNVTISGNPDNAAASDFVPLIAPIILTAAYWRDQLEEAYFNYNQGTESFDPDFYGVDWFNIGLGVPEGTTALDAHPTSCLVNPAYLTEITADANGTNSQKIKADLVQKAASYTQKNYADGTNFVYPNEGDGFVTFANTYEVLMNAFKELAERIKLQSQNLNYPIVHHDVSSGNETTDVVFTDVIGKGMSVTDITLKQNNKEPIEGVYDSSNGIYTFAGYQTTVKITEAADGQQTLVWRLPAREVSMFVFEDRNDVVHSPLTPADPTVLTFGLEFTDDIGAGPAYTNDFVARGQTIIPLTTVTYEIPGDNGYYFDEEHDTLKATQSGGENKTDNPTGTAVSPGQYSYTAGTDALGKSYAVAEGVLGNNGMVTGVLRTDMNIVIEKKWEDVNGNAVTDTSALPPVTVRLLRKADGSNTEEAVPDINPITLSNSNDYSETYTLPIRDSSNKRYTYYLVEDSLEGYYISSPSQSLSANDGTLSITNRPLPSEGAITVKKQWKNQQGGIIDDESSLPGVDISLMRHVTKYVPTRYSLTVIIQDRNNTSYTVKQESLIKNSTVDIRARIFGQGSNSGRLGVITLSDGSTTETVKASGNTTGTYGQENLGGYGIGGVGQTNYSQTIVSHKTITSDITLTYKLTNYTFSTTANVPAAVAAAHNVAAAPCYLETYTVTSPTFANMDKTRTDYDDPDYDQTATLSRGNGWQIVYPNIKAEETINGNFYFYKYYVDEISAIPGFTVSYSDNNTEGITSGVLTITNKEIGKIGPLPETGGEGAAGITGTGAALILTALVMLCGIQLISQRRKKERIKNI